MVTNEETYVVSTYLSPPGRAFTTCRHDQGVALWLVKSASIELVRYWELERLSGYKHHAMPLYGPESSVWDLIATLVAHEGVTMDQVSEIWGTPGLELTSPLPPFDCNGFPVHSIAHLFSGLCMDTEKFRNSTIIALAMDGGPDLTLEHDIIGDNWYAGAVSHKGKITLIPVESPCVLWAGASRIGGLEPGTLMALAHASTFSIQYDIAPVLAKRYLGGVPLKGVGIEIVDAMFNAAREQIANAAGSLISPLSDTELAWSAVAKLIQAVSIHIVRRNIEAMLEGVDDDPASIYLSISGGYALNCPTNSRLLDLYKFRGLLTPPCANDSGQALGIGLLGFFAQGQLDAKDVVTALPFAGDDHVNLSAARSRWARHIVSVQDFDEETWIDDISRQPVAWVDGAAEVGPRALGHRSLLGDPRSMATKDLLNTVKGRQWWRPVAPIVLEEFVSEWFVGGRPSPFMLETFLVAPEYQPLVPAIMHLDGSARIQTISQADDSFLASALSAFRSATGIPIICNTSLNGKGEPIANNADDAIAFCVRNGIEVAYIDRQRVSLDLSMSTEHVKAPPRPLASLYRDQGGLPADIYGPDADAELLYMLHVWPSLHKLTQSEDKMNHLRQIVRAVAKRNPEFRYYSAEWLEYFKALIEGRDSPLLIVLPRHGPRPTPAPTRPRARQLLLGIGSQGRGACGSPFPIPLISPDHAHVPLPLARADPAG
jgi:hypothetical protein